MLIDATAIIPPPGFTRFSGDGTIQNSSFLRTTAFSASSFAFSFSAFFNRGSTMTLPSMRAILEAPPGRADTVKRVPLTRARAPPVAREKLSPGVLFFTETATEPLARKRASLLPPSWFSKERTCSSVSEAARSFTFSPKLILTADPGRVMIFSPGAALPLSAGIFLPFSFIIKASPRTRRTSPAGKARRNIGAVK